MKKKYKVGFTASAFDLCHAGHILMLKEAKELCEHVVVALHDDPSRLEDFNYRMKTGNKPKNTPVMSLGERKTILEGLKYVDEVVVYSTEDELRYLLSTINYDVRILGSDWEGKPYTGHDIPHTSHFHKRTHNYSTSELRERVYKAELDKRRYASHTRATQKSDA